MSVPAIQGICHNGKIKALEKIPYREDKKVIIIFLDDVEDKRWDEVVATDFMNGYSEKDEAYDRL